jgi:actin-like ATPase involved in cell morphogenesis
MSYHLGIDLGTTYTAAAIHEAGRVEVIPLGDRGPSIPSVLYLKADGSIVAGDAANRHAVTDPERIAREFKRRLGDPTPVSWGGSSTPPELLTSHLLRWVYDSVVRAKGAAPATVVLTHPANWGPYKRDLLTQAAHAAGLSQVTLITEPQAAAISYASQERVDPGTVIAVYDLGGGTFDAAVLRKEASGTFSILGTPEGIERLGGIDFDAAVFNHVTQSLEGVFEDLDPEDEAAVAAVARLRQECTQAKEALSLDSEATIPVLLPNTQTEVRTTRSELENMIRPPLAETVTALERALRSADLTAADVSHVLLVGGSSRIPMVSGLVSAQLGRPVAVDAHPKHAIALGAAIVAAREAGVMVGDAAMQAPPTQQAPAAPTAPPPPATVSSPPGPGAAYVPAPQAPAPAPPPPVGVPQASSAPPPPPGAAAQRPAPPGQAAPVAFAPSPPGTPAAGPSGYPPNYPPTPPPGSPPGRGWDPTFDAANSETPAPSLGYRSASLPPPPGVSNDLPPGYASREERAHQRQRDKTKSRIWMAVGGVVLVIAVLAAIALTASQNKKDSLAIVKPGECFLGVQLNDVKVVDCADAHHGELVAINPTTDPNLAYPGVEALHASEDEKCIVAVEGYYGAARDVAKGAGVEIYPIVPSEDQWADNHKDTFCYVGSPDVEKTVSGSIKGQGAAATTATTAPGG